MVTEVFPAVQLWHQALTAIVRLPARPGRPFEIPLLRDYIAAMVSNSHRNYLLHAECKVPCLMVCSLGRLAELLVPADVPATLSASCKF